MGTALLPAQMGNTRDVICLLGFCKLPPFQPETASEAVRRGWSRSREKAAPSSSGCLLSGDEGPRPRVEQSPVGTACVFWSVLPGAKQEDSGALAWAGWFESAFVWQQQACAAYEQQRMSLTTAPLLLPVVECWLESGKRTQMFLLLAPVP